MVKRERRRPPGLVVIAMLALAQGVLGLLRALQWVQIGSDLMRQGVLLLPIIGAMAFGRAAMVALMVALYGLNLLGGESPARVLLWAIAPVVIIGYLLAPAGRRALGGGQA